MIFRIKFQLDMLRSLYLLLKQNYQTIKFFDCIFCKRQFKSYDVLQNHILKDHNINFYIKIDDIIADEITVIEYLPKTIELINSSSNDNINTDIYYNDKKLNQITLKPTSHYNIELENIKEGKYEIRVYPFNKSYFLYVKQIPEFNNKEADLILQNYIKSILC